MTFYLSRYVRDDVSMEQFMDGLMDFMNHSMKDPQNNIGEFDKSLTTMLERKIFNAHNPRSGLLFLNPSAASYILTHQFLMQLLFYPRVFQRKHEWSIIYLSPISRHLCQQNLIQKLPSIYIKYGREIDMNRGIIYLSTIDYFFMSFISYPIIIGPQIPKILNHLYSSYKYEKEINSIKNSRNKLIEFISLFSPRRNNSHHTDNNDEFQDLPINPFKHINFYYSRIFDWYLNMFLSSNQMNNHYRIKFIEIIGELWFGPSFEERPIGDRCHTLPLMQDLLFRIMEKQIDFQHNCMNTTQPQQSQRQSCICPELRCLLPYLYSFLRESFEFFPLDFIANLRIIIEMFLYVLAPWSIQYKLRNPDFNIKKMRETIRHKYLEMERKKKENILTRIIKKYLFAANDSNGSNNLHANNAIDENLKFLNNNNDDRLRDININNTQFEKADDLVVYELDGIESINLLVWSEYIIEMLPFYSSLINYFIDTLVKYDFGHPLKQLPVLKVFHLYKNKQVIKIIKETENVLYHNNFNQANEKFLYIVNIIQDITFKHVNEYKCLPFNQTQNRNINNSQKITHQKAQHLYIKCRKTMLRLCPQNQLKNVDNKEEEQDDADDDDESSDGNAAQLQHNIFLLVINFVVFTLFIPVLAQIMQVIFGGKRRKSTGYKTKGYASKMSYFVNPFDNVNIIRYIIGDLEALFEIGPQQQQSLMNQSIMYEPSQSVTNSPNLALKRREKRPKHCYNSNDNNIWNQPQGEWESYYVLKISQMVYNRLISKNEGIKHFYCKYLAKFHRKYLTDSRVIAWILMLVITFVFCHYILFYMVFFLFSLAVIIPQLQLAINY